MELEHWNARGFGGGWGGDEEEWNEGEATAESAQRLMEEKEAFTG